MGKHPGPSPGLEEPELGTAHSSRASGPGAEMGGPLGEVPSHHLSAQELPGSVAPTLAQQQLVNIHLETKASLKS